MLFILWPPPIRLFDSVLLCLYILYFLLHRRKGMKQIEGDKWIWGNACVGKRKTVFQNSIGCWCYPDSLDSSLFE